MSTGRLYPILCLGNDETPRSYVTRLTILHRRSNTLSFCTDMGLKRNKVFDGDANEIDMLADLTGADRSILSLNAVVRTQKKLFSLRNEILMPSVLRREHTRICPACVAEDIEATNLAPAIAVHGRVLWTITSIRTCPIHNLAIIDLSRQTEDDAGKPRSLFQNGLSVNDLGRVSRNPSHFETYLIKRINGEIKGTHWLDGLEFHAAVKICEVIGAVELHGREVAFNNLSDDDWRLAGDTGYLIATGQGIRTWLLKLQETFFSEANAGNGGNAGPQAIFGAFYKWAAFSKNPAFDPARELIRDHIVENMPVAKGEVILGRPVEKRRLHSIHTASFEFKAHHKKLRKILAFKDLLPANHEVKLDNQVLFDAGRAQQLYEEGWFHALTLTDLETYLGAGRVQARLLVESGILRPAIGSNEPDLRSYGFLKKDMDAFLEALEADAVPVESADENWLDIPAAAKRANCSSMEIVKLILKRELVWIGKFQGKHGYFSILVKLEEIKAKTRLGELDGLTATEAQKTLNTTWEVMRGLSELGLLKFVERINPVNRCPVKVVLRSDFETFKETYITHFQLCRERQVHHIRLTKQLAAEGILPAFDPNLLHTRIYRRADLKRL